MPHLPAPQKPAGTLATATVLLLGELSNKNLTFLAEAGISAKGGGALLFYKKREVYISDSVQLTVGGIYQLLSNLHREVYISCCATNRGRYISAAVLLTAQREVYISCCAINSGRYISAAVLLAAGGIYQLLCY